MAIRMCGTCTPVVLSPLTRTARPRFGPYQFSHRNRAELTSTASLADARTTIEELYAWQFDGPALRDMRGAEPLGQGRDAGALESF